MKFKKLDPGNYGSQMLDPNVPALLFIRNSTCNGVKAMLNFLTSTFVSEEFGSILLFEVDADDKAYLEFLKDQKITHVPTIILYNESSEIERIVGVVTIERIKKFLRQVF